MGGQAGAVPQMFLKCYVVGSVQGTAVVGTQTGAVLAAVGDLMDTFRGWLAILDGAQKKGQTGERRHICGHFSLQRETAKGMKGQGPRQGPWSGQGGGECHTGD